MKDWVKQETNDLIARMLTAWGAPAEAESPCEIVLEGYAAEARADIERNRDSCVQLLALWDDTVITPVVLALGAARTKKDGANIDAQLKTHAKEVDEACLAELRKWINLDWHEALMP